MENGLSIHFWSNVWLGAAPLCETYPLLFSLSAAEKASVADFLDWEKFIMGSKILKKSQGRGNTGIDITNASSLSSIHIVDKEDNWEWNLEKEGT